MVNLDAIRKCAEQDLTLKSPDGQTRTLLWDHSNRVCESALLIPGLAEFVGKEISRELLAIVALYHDAGWAIQYEAGDVKINAIQETVTSAIQYTQAATLMLERLDHVANKEILDQAAECIRVLGDHHITHPCAQIVAEADHLDEFSIVTLCSKVFKQVFDGRSVNAVIETWDNQKKYKYWTAKIKDSFRFGSTRLIAESRLKVLERFIEDMRGHHRNIDVHNSIDPGDRQAG